VKTALLVLGLMVIVVVVVLVAAEHRWRARSRAVAASLREGWPPVASYSSGQLSGLPAPVQRYFRAVLREGQPLARHARLWQRGTFLVRAEANRWGPFTATQDLRVRPAAFVWDARISMAPGVAVRVRDSFVDGKGAMYGAVMALVTVVRMEDTADMATASLMRYLAEACWVPAALLPSAGVAWTAVDDSTARASLTVSGATASVDFHFGADSLIWRMTAVRSRSVNGGSVPTPWEGRWTEYGDRNGVRIPVAGEVAWLLPAGPQPYWRGRVTAIEYD
jgi:hypothetical protein